MTDKKPGQTFWNDLKEWASKNSDQYVSVEIPSENTDTGEDASPLKAREGYFRVLLTDLSLDGSGDLKDGLSPTLHAAVKLKYGDRGIVNINRVVALMNEPRISGRDPRCYITELMPYVGGKVEVAAGLLALPRLNREVAQTAFNFFGEVTGPDTATCIEESLAAGLSAKVDSGVKALMESAGGYIHLGLHHASENVQTLRPGYIAAVMAKPGQLDPAQFSVRDGRLYYREPTDAAPRLLENFDYMLFQIEVREERDDWQIKSVQKPLDKAVRALLRGNREEADNYRMLALTTACQSADLTVADRRRLTLAISDELKSLESSGRGAIGGEERDLNQIMAARAMPLKLAQNKPAMTFSDVLVSAVGGFPLGGVQTAEILKGSDDGIASAKPPKLDMATVPLAPQYRRFNAWVAERTGNDEAMPIAVAETCTLKLNVGFPVAGSLITSADAVVSESEIPEGGLETTWFLNSKNVELKMSPNDPLMKVEQNTSGWKAELSLHIPKDSESDLRQLLIAPTAVEDAEIFIIILARGTLYRQFKLELKVVSPTVEPKAAPTDVALKIVSEVVHVPGKYAGLQPQHEWQTPPGVLRIIVQGGGRAFLLGDTVEPVSQGIVPFSDVADWSGSLTGVAGYIKSLLKRADEFRQEFSDELNDIDATDLDGRLAALQNEGGRFWQTNLADAAHTQVWEQDIARSDKLFKLASEGYDLYETIFPRKSELRRILDDLTPGWLIDLNWLVKNDPARPAHVPWNLLYTQPPQKGQPIDPSNFWGLRFRINYTMNSITNIHSPALGYPSETEVAYGFYWGTDAADKEIADEVAWQKTEWAKWGKPVYVPDSNVADAAKDQLVTLMKRQTPTPHFYFFCHYGIGSDNEPVLRFGNSPDPEDNVELYDLGAGELAGQPLVFVNACTSGGAGAYEANKLVEKFFLRNCRSYLGTEVKVPIRFASKFAKIFYSFFYRVIAPEPMAAGEAAYQARCFLWRDYRNIGGLLYTYLNQYNLYMATADELSRMHVHH